MNVNVSKLVPVGEAPNETDIVVQQKGHIARGIQDWLEDTLAVVEVVRAGSRSESSTGFDLTRRLTSPSRPARTLIQPAHPVGKRTRGSRQKLLLRGGTTTNKSLRRRRLPDRVNS